MAAMRTKPPSIFMVVLACGVICTGALAQESKPLGPSRESVAPTSDERGPVASRGMIGGTVVPLAGVLGLIGACAYIFRKAAAKGGGLMGALGAGGRAPSGVISVLGRYPVSRGTTLVLLKVDRRVLLVCQSSGRGVGGGSMSTLCEITDAEEVASILLKTRDESEAEQAEKFERVLRESDRRTSEVFTRAAEPASLSSLRSRVQRLAGGGA